MDWARHVVSQQREFFLSGATRSVAFRRLQLERLLQALDLHAEALILALQADLRRPAAEAWFSEIGMVQAEIRYALRCLDRWTRPRSRRIPWWLRPGHAWVQPEPLGVVLILGAWNYPVQLLLVPLVSAVAAGNCVILKPSEHAPRTSEVLTRMIRLTYPESYVAICPGDRSVAAALLQERYDKIFFTGSCEAGRAVMAAAARHLTPVTLELGGQCPCVVCPDAAVATAARRIAWGKFTNAGQTCVAPDHVWVHRSILEPFTLALVQAVRSFYGPDPRQSPDYGRIVDRQHLERLISFLHPGRILLGGQWDTETLYLAPTLLTDVPAEAPVLQQEIFGPILPILIYDELDVLLQRMSNKPSPLTVYLFTRQRSMQEKVLHRTRSGNVCINDVIVHLLARELPFGGLGESGMGSYHGRAGFDNFTHYRSILYRRSFPDLGFRYPPYRFSLETLRRWSRWLLRD
ncbi:MAG: aldehyde dehydrogenase family protein [Verrucomicrobiota bacterium]|nr:aldehyde dehydrogenase family protein [Limisphaera sp.]MDW8380605.1 aldehyde dehydrogenase family protein [Verrucomicrobiota bacterium]